MHLPLHAPLNGGCVANKSDKAIRNLNSAHNCNITPGGQVAARGDVCKPLVAVTLMTIQLSHLESTVAERSPRQAINPIFEVYYRICMQYTKIYIKWFFASARGVSRAPAHPAGRWSLIGMFIGTAVPDMFIYGRTCLSTAVPDMFIGTAVPVTAVFFGPAVGYGRAC